MRSTPVSNGAGTTDPTRTTDSSLGYSNQSVYFNTSTLQAFVCRDPSVGAAIWEPLWGFGRHILVRHLLELAADYTESQIDVGLIRNRVFKFADLPATNPAGSTVPGFAIVLDGNDMKVAYWDFIGASGWTLTSFPYNNPILIPGHVINQDPSNGTGNTAWQFSMGSLIHIVAACNADRVSFKLGAGGAGQNHSWALLKSTTPGPTQPLASSFTNVLASGIINYTTANVWQEIDIPDQALAIDDWIAPQIWIGGGGQTANIAALRSAAQLREDYGELVAGIYASAPGTFPGTNPTPTFIVGTVIYGVASVDLQP